MTHKLHRKNVAATQLDTIENLELKFLTALKSKNSQFAMSSWFIDSVFGIPKFQRSKFVTQMVTVFHRDAGQQGRGLP
jgi:hypothetical protein